MAALVIPSVVVVVVAGEPQGRVDYSYSIPSKKADDATCQGPVVGSDVATWLWRHGGQTRRAGQDRNWCGIR